MRGVLADDLPRAHWDHAGHESAMLNLRHGLPGCEHPHEIRHRTCVSLAPGRGMAAEMVSRNL